VASFVPRASRSGALQLNSLYLDEIVKICTGLAEICVVRRRGRITPMPVWFRPAQCPTFVTSNLTKIFFAYFGVRLEFSAERKRVRAQTGLWRSKPERNPIAVCR
jgi:hypothetical protein